MNCNSAGIYIAHVPEMRSWLIKGRHEYALGVQPILCKCNHQCKCIRRLITIPAPNSLSCMRGGFILRFLVERVLWESPSHIFPDLKRNNLIQNIIFLEIPNIILGNTKVNNNCNIFLCKSTLTQPYVSIWLSGRLGGVRWK